MIAPLALAIEASPPRSPDTWSRTTAPIAHLKRAAEHGLLRAACSSPIIATCAKSEDVKDEWKLANGQPKQFALSSDAA
jgi:hypothetical protein